MNLYIDVNVIVDVLGFRLPFYFKSSMVMQLCTTPQAVGYTSVASFATIEYILKKQLPRTIIPQQLHTLRSIITPVDVTTAILDQALYSNFKDFEDAMQYFCARSCSADYLVTRNTEDFAAAEMAVVTPEDFLSIYHSLQ